MTMAVFVRSNIRQPVHSYYTNRLFSVSLGRQDHYKTLGVPQGASKAQIKSHFYQLSKKHHPDVSKDPRSSQVFNAVSEAYSILSNDRERRAYDRSLHRGAVSPASTHPYSPHTPSSRGPRATHAWEYSSRPRGSTQHKPPPPDYTFNAQRQGPQPGQGGHYTRPIYHDVLTGTRRKTEEAERELDRLRNESGWFRAVQLLGLLALSVVAFGGFRPPNG